MIWIYTTDGEYFDKAMTAAEAAKLTHNSPGNVSGCLKGRLNQSKGYVFVHERPGANKIRISSQISEFFKFSQMSLGQYLEQSI